MPLALAAQTMHAAAPGQALPQTCADVVSRVKTLLRRRSLRKESMSSSVCTLSPGELRHRQQLAQLDTGDVVVTGAYLVGLRVSKRCAVGRTVLSGSWNAATRRLLKVPPCSR